jgi:hypothetical protein
MIKRGMITAITESVDKEWPKDHPRRQGIEVVLPDSFPADYLICSPIGEPRLPSKDGTPDAFGTCCNCGQTIVYRDNQQARSAQKKVCTFCWDFMI